MRPFALLVCALLAICGLQRPYYAEAAERVDMLGTWRWKEFAIEVTECPGKGLCAKVVQGPRSVGQELFATAPIAKDGDWFGQIVDPATGTAYNTRMRLVAPDRWRLDGCTQSGVCIGGELVKSK